MDEKVGHSGFHLRIWSWGRAQERMSDHNRGVGKGGSKGAVAPLEFGGYTLLFYCCSTPRFSC